MQWQTAWPVPPRVSALPLSPRSPAAGRRTAPVRLCVLQSLLRLFRRHLQRLELFLRLVYGIADEPVLLRQQLRIPRIKFQELVDIARLALGIPDLCIDAL